MDLRAALVVNTRSRSGGRLFTDARKLLRDMDVPVEATYPVRDPTRLREVVRRALADGQDLIIVGGGDGSVSSVVDPMAHSHAVLGLLPLGTGNDFARTLGIPLDLEGACATIASGKVVDVDLGLAGDDYYVNVASVGIATVVTQSLSPQLKRLAGALAYPVATLRALARHKAFSATLSFPAGDHSPIKLERLLQIAVGNGRFYGGGMVVAPSSSVDDRTLDVYAVELGRWRDLIGMVRQLRSGRFVDSHAVHYYRTSTVRIETDPPLAISIDGELVDRMPELFSLAPNALKVLVPEVSDAATFDAHH